MKKIVIKVPMNCEKCKAKVLQIAAKTQGVNSVAVVGEISDGKIMVIGDGVDSVTLTKALRKKLGSANIETVEEVKEEEKKKEKENDEANVSKLEYYPLPPQSYYYVPADMLGVVTYPNNTCSIM